MTVASDNIIQLVVDNLVSMLSMWPISEPCRRPRRESLLEPNATSLNSIDQDQVEPGGNLQWVERHWLSKFPNSAFPTEDSPTQLT